MIEFLGLDKRELYEIGNGSEFSDNDSINDSDSCKENYKSVNETPSETPAPDHKVDVTAKSEVTYEKTIRITLDLLVGANGLGFILPPGTMPIHSQPPPQPQPEPPKPDIQPEPAPTIELCDTKITLDFGEEKPPTDEDDATHSSMPDLEPISDGEGDDLDKDVNAKYDFVDEYLEHRRSLIPDYELRKMAKRISEEDIAPHTEIIDCSIDYN